MSVPIYELKNRLMEAMQQANMRAIDLSKKTHIPKSSISQYMSGFVKPNSERVYLISKALGVNEAWLLGYDVPKERGSLSANKTKASYDALTEKEEKLIKAYREKPEMQNAVDKLLSID